MCVEKNAERGGIGVGDTHLRVGEERQGSNAFDTMSGRCFDPAFLYESARWEQHRRGRTYGTLHQPAPTTPVHQMQVPVEQAGKEQPATEDAGREMTKSSGNRPTALTSVFWLYSAHPITVQATVTQVSSSRQGDERKQEAGNRQREERSPSPRGELWNGRCCIWPKNKNNQEPGREDPSTFERHSQDQETGD